MEDEGKKFLTEEERSKLELNFKDQNIEKLTSTVIKQGLDKIRLEMEIVKLRLNIKETKYIESVNKLNKLKEEHRKYNNEIKEKYDLPTGWGFDPETGLLTD